ncbi:MAG: hypothetical protein JW870_21280 [Candidatus Delongbacteria bacterium]|nr:hypothetical protein [Candidatus Delongbacteria bacterium]
MNEAKLQQKLCKVLPLIKDNDIAKRHFYEKINSNWLETLTTKGVFQPDTSLSKISDDGYYQDWIEGRYLSRISNNFPQAVYNVITVLELESHTNPLIYEILTEIVANVATKVDVTIMVEKIINEKWIGSKGRTTFMSFKLKDLVSNLISALNFDLLNNLLKSLLSFNLPENYLEISKKRFIDPIPLIEVYSLEEILKEISQVDFEDKKVLDMIIETLVISFDKYLELAKDVEDYKESDEYEDYSFIWKSSIDYDKDRLHEIKEDFVIAIRDLLIKNIEIIDSETLELLSKSKKRIFRRIKLFIYSRANLPENLVVSEVINNVEDRHNIHELRQLLVLKFNTITKKNKSEILKKINGSFSDLDIEERFKIGYKTELLKPIAKYLTEDEKEQYKEYIQNEHEYIPSYQFSGMRSGPNSRYSKDQLLEKSHQQLVELFIEDQKWFEENTHNEEMYSPRGLGRLWQSIVAENYKLYQDNLPIYDPSKILPLYIYHLLNGIEEVANKDIKVNWNKIIHYIEYLLKLYEEGKFVDSIINDSFDVGNKEEVMISILRLVENGFKGKNLIPISLKSKLWGIITKVFDIAKDTDESFVEKNDKDYFTHSIKSIGGLILHNVYYYGFWLINKRKLQSYPKEIVDFISTFIDEHIDYKTGLSVMGKYLPWTYSYSSNLFSKQKEKLLPISDKKIRYVTWETYLANTIFLKPYQKLRDIYVQAINELNQAIPERRYRVDPKNTLLEHIMVGYIHQLDNTKEKETLFDILLNTKSVKHIAYAIDFVGRAYASSDNERKKSIGEEQIVRIKQIWETVLEKCKDAEIFENFGWWIKKDYYKDNEWLLEMLNKTLDKSNGYIDPDFRVLEQLNLLVIDYPLLTAQALDKMVKSTKKEKTYYFRDKEVGLIIEQLESQSIEEVNKLVKDIRETLVGYGYIQYSK